MRDLVLNPQFPPPLIYPHHLHGGCRGEIMSDVGARIRVCCIRSALSDVSSTLWTRSVCEDVQRQGTELG